MATAKQIAWRKKFARLYGRKKGRKVKHKATGGVKTAKRRWWGKKKNGNGSKKQGIVSYVINGITVVMALSDLLMRAGTARSDNVPKGQKLAWFMDTLTADYTGYNPGFCSFPADGMGKQTWDAKRLIRGYAPIAGAYIFKTATGMVLKKAPIKSLIPKIT